MSFLDCEFFGITSGKLEGHLLDYDHPPLSGDVIFPFAEETDYYPHHHLEVAETSMDLEAMIESNIGNIPDYLSHGTTYHPQPVVKLENHEDEDSASCLPSTLNDTNDYPTVMMPSPYGTSISSPAGRSTSSITSVVRRTKSGAKAISKDSDEYKRRRMLNNVAVKKSREKAKAESRLIAQRVTILSADKERLERRVEQLSKEIQFLHGLFSKFSDIPEPIKLQVASAFSRLQTHPR